MKSTMIDSVTIRQMQAMRKSGMSIAKIARAIGCHKHTVYRWVDPTTLTRLRAKERDGYRRRRAKAGLSLGAEGCYLCSPLWYAENNTRAEEAMRAAGIWYRST